MDDESQDSVAFPIGGTLDLHTFDPGQIKQLIPDYIEACLARKIFHLRIIHGKGRGVLRRIVHSILDKNPAVVSYRHEEGSGGSWGATIVDLKNPEE
jgi:DNA-nicking Smr family endonuclease